MSVLDERATLRVLTPLLFEYIYICIYHLLFHALASTTTLLKQLNKRCGSKLLVSEGVLH